MNKLKIKKFCKALNIRSGDNLMIHGDISVISQFNFNKIQDIKKKLNYFYKSLKKEVSINGNILILVEQQALIMNIDLLKI